jgi:acyl carrier protein
VPEVANHASFSSYDQRCDSSTRLGRDLTDTFEIVADAIAEECAVPREKITPESHLVDALGLDSIAFLDVCYALDMKLNIKIPFAEWVNAVNTGKADAKEYLILRNLVGEIDRLIAQPDKAQPA